MSEVTKIIDEVFKGPVFDGTSFPEGIDRQVINSQFNEVAGHYFRGLTEVVAEGSPDLSGKRRQQIVGGLAVTCVGFGSCLNAGEIKDARKLGDLAVLIGVTGWSNWLPTEDGDEAIALAIDALYGDVDVPRALREAVDARSKGLNHMRRLTTGMMRPEDVPFSLSASHELVRHGLLAHRLSTQYKVMYEAGKAQEFLDRPDVSETVANSLIVTGALPSAVTPLYGIYRHERPAWPDLAEVNGESEILELLQAENAFVRVFDDKGDRKVDGGTAFSLNLFNQSHPMLIGAFLRQAGVDSPSKIGELIGAFEASEDPSAADYATDFFVTYVRERVSGLSPRVRRKYPGYITLSMRAIEAAYVNKVGYETVTGQAVG